MPAIVVLESMQLDREKLLSLVKVALDEDVGPGDLTSLAALEPNPVTATISAKSGGVLSGSAAARLVFEIVDSANDIEFLIQDGASFMPSDVIAHIKGFNLTVMTSERVGLNFLARLSGIASYTRKFVDLVSVAAGDTCRVLDTRKTTPGWRQLEKLAVLHGGGQNHRQGLFDMILIKDNHIASAGSIRAAIARSREYLKSSDFRLQFDAVANEINIEVEINSLAQLEEAIECGVKRLLLDNQSTASLTKLVDRARELDAEIKLEVSGNVSLKNVGEVAALGVDFISIGSLTHSAPASDFSLRICE